MENNKDGFTLSTPVAILLAGVLVAAALLYALVYIPAHPLGTVAQQQNGGTQQAATVKPISPITNKDHIRGDYKTAQLTLVEYSDLQCPYCGQFHPVMEKLKADYGDKVAWVYRQFPLSQIHPQALPAALASECVAAAKGNDAFWRFADSIFKDQKDIGTEQFHLLAQQEGISPAALDACIAKNNTAPIEASFNEAVAAGGNGTPFTVILDKSGKTVATFPGSMPYASAKAQIDALLANAK
jgi:protein-disulfide isomerase